MSIKIILRDCLHYLYGRWGNDIWNIGIVPFSPELFGQSDFPRIKWLKHSFTDRWFADPFIMSDDGVTYTILCETYFYRKRRGVIGILKVSKDKFALVSYKTVLELDTHLSFPAIGEENGQLVVYPENSISGKNTMYRFCANGNTLEFVRVNSEYPLTDAVAFEYDSNQFLISTLLTNPNGNTATIFAREIGNEFVPVQEIVLNDKTARSAGIPFRINGRLIRPAQICEGGYGRGLCFQELSKREGRFTLDEICRFAPNDKKYDIGLHTFNKYGDVAIVDGYRAPSGTAKWIFTKLSYIITFIKSNDENTVQM